VPTAPPPPPTGAGRAALAVVAALGVIAALLLGFDATARWGRAPVLAGWGLGVIAAAWFLLRRGVARRAALREQQAALDGQKMEAVGRLAGGLAHDLNNYLAAVRTHAELLHDRELPRERIVRQTGAILRTVVKASALVERLLTFSRRQPAMPEVIDLNDVVTGFDQMIRGSVRSGVAVETRLQPELWRVEIDLARIEQVLMNLVVNASDAMPEGGRLTIETANRRAARSHPLAGDAVVLSVADSGIGIRPEDRASLFEPFFTTKSSTGSSGLGLATVYAAAEQAHGRVTVDSVPGEGSRFEIWLPRCDRPLSAASLAPAERRRLAGNERLLLVDDNEELAEAARLLLEGLGYQVEVASDPKAVLAQARAGASAGLAWELVITDVQMPGMSGRELVAALRQLAPLPAIYLSGFTELIEVRQAPGSAEAYFIKKPFPARALAAAVRELLDEGGAAPAAGAEDGLESSR
jgi:signal transduction histidine kinase/CheY-like chemotaxis protein